MSVERFGGLGPQENYYSTTIDQAIGEMRKNPGNSPSFYLAVVLGSRASEGLRALDKTLTERWLGTPGRRLLYPGSEEFQRLTPDEKQSFLFDYSGVWAAAALKTWEFALRNCYFDFNLFEEFYTEFVRGTYVIQGGEGDNGIFPFDEQKIRSLLQYRTRAHVVFSEEGLALVPPLRRLLTMYDALPIIRGQIAPLYSALENALELKLSSEPPSVAKVAKIAQNMPVRDIGDELPKIVFDKTKWDWLWTEAEEREKKNKENPK